MQIQYINKFINYIIPFAKGWAGCNENIFKNFADVLQRLYINFPFIFNHNDCN
jgi:hypothetical protein